MISSTQRFLNLIFEVETYLIVRNEIKVNALNEEVDMKNMVQMSVDMPTIRNQL